MFNCNFQMQQKMKRLFNSDISNYGYGMGLKKKIFSLFSIKWKDI